MDINSKQKANVEGVATILSILRTNLENKPDSPLKFIIIAFCYKSEETNLTQMLEELQQIDSLLDSQGKRLGLSLPFVNLMTESSIKQFKHLDIID